jgi:hypothetical protein
MSGKVRVAAMKMDANSFSTKFCLGRTSFGVPPQPSKKA